MAETFSVKAILSASDKGFSAVMRSARESIGSLKSTVSSGIGFGVMMAAGQKAFDVVSSGVSGLIGDLNSAGAAWKTFQGNMEMNGHTAAEIKSIKGELQYFAEATIYSSSDMASTFAQLEAVGTKNTTKLVKGFGGLAAAAENPTQAMKTLSQQATQMAAKPTVAWEDFKLMLEQTPAGISAVAKQMGKSTQSLIKDVQNGKLATEDFFDAISAVGTNDAFTKLATEYKTVGQAMDGLSETAANKLQPAFDTLSAVGIKAISKLVDKVGELDGEKIAAKLTSGLDKIKPYWDVLSSAASEVGSAFGDALSSITSELGKLTGAFGSTESIQNFSDVINSAKGALTTFAGFLEEHSDIIAKLITQLPKLLVAYKGFKIVKSVTPGIIGFGSAIGKLAKSGLEKLSPNLKNVSKGQDAVGKSSSGSSKKILSSAKAFMMLGAGVSLISGGFYLLAQSAVALSDAGGSAIAIMFGLVAAVAALGAGMMVMIKNVSIGPAKLKALSTAMLSLGASVLLISTGFAVLAQSAIALSNAGAPAIVTMFGMVAAIGALMVVVSVVGKQLTAASIGMIAFGAAVLIAGAGMYVMASASINLVNAGTPAIAVMAGMVVAMAGMMVLAAALGPALTAGAVGFIAFGAAIVLVATGALIASAALAVVAAVLPTVVQYGTQGAISIAALGAAMLAFSVGAAAAGVASVALGVGLVAVGAGLTVVGAAVVVVSAGVLALAAGATLLGAGLTLVATSATILGAALPLVATGAMTSAASLTAMLAAATALSAVILLLSTSVVALGVAAAAGTVGIAAFGLGMTAAAVGVAAMSVALKAVNSSMKSIAKNAKSAKSSISSMKSSLNIVNEGLDALGSKAKSAINSFIKSFSNAESKAKTAGRNIGNNINDGVKSGLNKLPSTVNNAMNQFNSGIRSGGNQAISSARSISSSISSALRSAGNSSYSSGRYIGQGLANGMRSMLGTVRSVAAQLAAAADAAIRAKARIHSPSKVSKKDGAYWGEGWVLGILSKVKDTRNAITELLYMPKMGTPALSLAGTNGLTLNDDYEYGEPNHTYTIYVISELDGKQVAKSTAVYTQKELEKLEKQNNRKHGIR